MIMDSTATLEQFGNTLYEAFVSPGVFLLSHFAAQVPTLAETLGVVDKQSGILPLILSLAVWFLLAVVAIKILQLWQNLLRIVTATCKAITFRVSLAKRNFRTALTRTLRRLIPGQSNRAVTTLEVEFDDLDLAVLRSTARLGPGFTTSAPELAGQLQLRPGMIQGSLDKLSNNKMLDCVIGSSDGFETYRLSQSGAYYMAMWLRQEREPRSQTQQR
jgi:hypothetical protein